MLHRSLAGLGFALGLAWVPAAHAAFEIEGVNQVTLQWAPASGPVAGYRIEVTRNSAATPESGTVATTQAVVGGVPGDTIVVRVAARDSLGRLGPYSPNSAPIRFLEQAQEPEPSPAPGGGAGGASRVPPYDVDGDGDSDVLLRDPLEGGLVAYAIENGALRSLGEIAFLDSRWAQVGSGDHDGNGAADLVLQRLDNGRIDLWLLDSARLVGGAMLRKPGDGSWILSASADFDGDGLDDLLLRDTGSGALELWRTDATRVTEVESFVGAGSGWTLAAAGDFDGNGVADLLWHEESQGRLHLWTLDAAQGLAGAEELVLDANLGPGWQPVGCGDFDGDGLEDVLLEDRSAGRVRVLSPFATGAFELDAVGGERELVGIGDFDADGRSEVVWLDGEAGGLALWRLDASDGLLTARFDDPFDSPAGAPGCPGDIDGDGLVGVGDYEKLRACYGDVAEGSCTPADLNGDGMVGGPDAQALIGLFGQACAP